MLRILTFLAFLLFIGRLLWPAGKPLVATGGPVTIEMSVWGMPWENDLYTKVYLPEFERENPDIRVRFHHFEDYPNRVLLSHAGGIAPDVIRQNTGFAMNWIRRGVNLPLNKYLDGPEGVNRDDFIPITMEKLQYNGETWGLPQDINIVGLYFNKDLFDKAGIRYPDENWTWDDLADAARRLTIDKDNDGHPEVIGLDMAWGGGFYLPFAFQAGGHIWNEDETRTVIDSPENARALAFYKSLMTHYSLTQSNSQRGGLGPDKFFEQGKVAMFVDGSWRTPSLKKNAPNLRFGVAPMPGGKKRMSVSGSCLWAVSSQSRHPEAAYKLARFLSTKDALLEYWRYLWVAPPARWSSLRDPKFRKVTGADGKIPGIPTEAEFQEKCGWIPEVLENGWTTLETSAPYADVLGLHLNEEVDRVLLENKDPAKALADAARATNKQIESMEKTGGQL